MAEVADFHDNFAESKGTKNMVAQARGKAVEAIVFAA